MNAQKYKKKTTHTICKTKNQDFSDKLSVVPPIGIDSIRSTIRVGFPSYQAAETGAIVRDKNHPRFMEMYERWRAQLTSDAPCKQFPNFVRAVLASEKRNTL